MAGVFLAGEDDELDGLPGGHICYGAVEGVILGSWVFPGAVFAVGFDEVEAQGFDGDVELFAHFSQACVRREPEAQALKAVVADCEAYLGLRCACPAE